MRLFETIVWLFNYKTLCLYFRLAVSIQASWCFCLLRLRFAAQNVTLKFQCKKNTTLVLSKEKLLETLQVLCPYKAKKGLIWHRFVSFRELRIEPKPKLPKRFLYKLGYITCSDWQTNCLSFLNTLLQCSVNIRHPRGNKNQNKLDKQPCVISENGLKV